MYEGRKDPEYAGSHVFIIPTSVSSWHEDGEYNSEIDACYPIARYVDSKTLVDSIIGVPPLIIESYPVDEEGRQGHVLFAPVMPDVFADLGYEAGMQMSEKIVLDTARFARERIGAKVAGLGALLPLAVDLGHRCDIDGLVVTTGHGGTVDLVARTVQRVVEAKGMPNNAIGIVGARGSIGRASLAALLDAYPRADFVVADPKLNDGMNNVSADAAMRYLSSFGTADRGRIKVVPGVTDVFDTAKVNVSAITGSIDVGNDVHADMDGVVIVDDSQPGAFARAAVEARGGRVVWVVGQDQSPNGSLTRTGAFRYGDRGLNRQQDLFGCEAEAYAVYRSGDLTNGVRGRVTPAMQRNISRLFNAYDIGVSDVFQSDGKPVVL